MEGKLRHFFKTDDYFAIGVWTGWIVVWLYLAWDITTGFIEVRGSITLAEFVWVNFIPIIFLIWNGSIVYRSRSILYKMKQNNYGMYFTGVIVIVILMTFIVLPLFTKYADTILFM